MPSRKGRAKPAAIAQRASAPVAPAKAVGTDASPSARDTIQSRLIAALKHPSGAHLEQLMQLSGWQAHSVRGFISGVLRKKLGLVVDHERGEQGTVYAIRDTSASAGGVQ